MRRLVSPVWIHPNGAETQPIPDHFNGRQGNGDSLFPRRSKRVGDNASHQCQSILPDSVGRFPRSTCRNVRLDRAKTGLGAGRVARDAVGKKISRVSAKSAAAVFDGQHSRQIGRQRRHAFRGLDGRRLPHRLGQLRQVLPPHRITGGSPGALNGIVIARLIGDAGSRVLVPGPEYPPCGPAERLRPS